MSYTHIQCIGYQVPTVAKRVITHSNLAWKNGEWSIPSGSGTNGAENVTIRTNWRGKFEYNLVGRKNDTDDYLNDLSADNDAKNRVIRFLNILKRTQDTIGQSNDATLKVFMAPEFYFRPEKIVGGYNAYSYKTYKAIKEVLRQTIYESFQLRHWLIVPGTIMWRLEKAERSDKRKISETTYFNSCVYIHLSGKGDKVSHVLEKAKASHIDGVPFKLAGPYAAPEILKKYYGRQKRNKHIFEINGIKAGIETCLEHMMYGTVGLIRAGLNDNNFNIYSNEGLLRDLFPFNQLQQTIGFVYHAADTATFPDTVHYTAAVHALINRLAAVFDVYETLPGLTSSQSTGIARYTSTGKAATILSITSLIHVKDHLMLIYNLQRSLYNRAITSKKEAFEKAIYSAHAPFAEAITILYNALGKPTSGEIKDAYDLLSKAHDIHIFLKLLSEMLIVWEKVGEDATNSQTFIDNANKLKDIFVPVADVLLADANLKADNGKSAVIQASKSAIDVIATKEDDFQKYIKEIFNILNLVETFVFHPDSTVPIRDHIFNLTYPFLKIFKSVTDIIKQANINTLHLQLLTAGGMPTNKMDSIGLKDKGVFLRNDGLSGSKFVEGQYIDTGTLKDTTVLNTISINANQAKYYLPPPRTTTTYPNVSSVGIDFGSQQVVIFERRKI